MRRSRRRGVAAVGGGLALCLTALAGAQPTAALQPDGPGRSDSSTVRPALPAPTVLPPRIAFTDDSDELVAKPGSQCESGRPWECGRAADLLTRGAGHAAEASFSGDDLTFVSDVDEPSGEVYVSAVDTEAPTPARALLPLRRVTCDGAVETHPVLSPDGTMVAYASDAGGGWSIWVVWIDSPTPSPTGTEPPPVPCADLPRAKVADGPGADLWPTWLGDGVVAFSRSGPAPLDPLGDLYAAHLVGRGETVPAEAAVRLTDGPSAETQPRAFETIAGGEAGPPEYAVVFTTTQFRPDGSLAGIGGLGAERLGLRVPSSLWRGLPVQSTEAVYAESEGSRRIGFTSTRDDPFGDVLRATLQGVEVEDDAFGLVADEESVIEVSAESGWAESHVAFTDSYYDSETDAVYTRRSLSADVSDVLAADGSGRRIVAGGSLDVDGTLVARDESTPTYSPDGTRIAYSRTAATGREIVTARADGTDVQPLLSSRPDEAVDLEPAWSPDGTRIAFVRAVEPDEAPSTSQIYVATVATRLATLVSQTPPEAALWDENPSWSPDGTRLVIARRVVPRPDLTVTVDAPATAVRGTRFAATVTVADAGGDLLDGATLGLTSSFPISTTDPRCRTAAPTALECDYGPMTPGDAPALAVSVTADRAGRGTITARVVATDVESNAANNSAEAVVDVTEPPDIAVALDMPPDVGYLGTETLTVTVTNAEAAARTGPFTVGLVADTSEGSPGRLEFSSDNLPAGCVRDSATTAHCAAGPLGPGESSDFRLTVIGTQGGEASVTASVAPLPDEQVTSNNSATGTTPVQPAPPPPDVSVTLRVPTSLDVGDGTTAIVFVGNDPAASNTGPVVVRLAVSSSEGTDALAFSTSGMPLGCVRDDASTAHCSVDDLAPGSQTRFDVPMEAVAPNDSTVSAQVDPLQGETDTSDNGAEVDVTVTEPPPPPTTTTEPPVINVPPASQSRSPATQQAPPTRHFGPAPSPRAAAFPLEAPSQLWVVDATTGAGAAVVVPPAPGCPPSRVCSPTAVEGRVPAWSPDGLRIAYEVRGAVRLVTLTDADLDRVADRPETVASDIAVTGFAADGAPTASRPVLSAATDPAWSPDGVELAVAGQPAGQPDQSGIYALRPDGTGLRTIAQERGPETEPVWQPFADVSVDITATPAGGPQGFATVLTVTARNSGPARATDVTLRVGIPPGLTVGVAPAGCIPVAGGLTCAVGDLAAGAARAFAIPAMGDVPGSHTVDATVATPVPDRVPDNNTGSVVVTVTVIVVEVLADLVVAVRTTTPGYVGGFGTTTVTVRNAGPRPVPRATLTLVHPASLVVVTAAQPCLTGVGSCAVPALAPGGAVTFTATTRFDAAGSGPVTATVSSTVQDPVLSNNRATAALTVLKPVLRLSPDVAAPSGVTVASGTDFPPGARLLFTWDVGTMQRMGPATVRADGTIPAVQIVIFRRDALGVRRLRATGVVARRFGPVEVELLVAPRNVAPPGFVERD